MMKAIRFLITLLLLGTATGTYANPLDVPIKTIGGQAMNAKLVEDKVTMVVNIATRCGYTKQLDDLEKLYQKYKDKGFVILGVPSNDFGGQTPESNEEVKNFCKLNYGVSFPLTEKVAVKGDKKHDLIKNLLAKSKDTSEIQWNFEKFLVNKKGQVVARFKSAIEPLSAEIKKAIEGAL